MSFEKALAFVLKWEGGYVNDPKDPGGETKYGISKRSWPDLDITNLTQEQAASIYHLQYWGKVPCHGLSEPLDLVVFDSAVNCGVRKAQDWLGITAHLDGDSRVQTFLGLRKLHYQKLRDHKTKEGKQNWARFYKGWMNRVMDLEKEIAK